MKRDTATEIGFGMVENIVEKGENAGYQHFRLFPQCFPNRSISRSLNLEVFVVGGSGRN